MKPLRYELGLANRLGNRSINQDRVAVAELGSTVVLTLADGLGGHPRGELAAQVLVDSITRRARRMSLPVARPREFLQQAIEAAHDEIYQAGLAQDPPVTPRTTVVVCLVQGEHAWWAHAGDSRLYHIHGRTVLSRTRDHTRVEEMLQRGELRQEEAARHPQRNVVTHCLGGNPNAPPLSYGEALLEPDDVLLLCSDGLWSALQETEIVAALGRGPLDDALEFLAERAESSSYPYSDNISGVALRWHGLARQPDAKTHHGQRQQRGPGDDLDSAIDEIQRALAEYGHELDDG